MGSETVLSDPKGFTLRWYMDLAFVRNVCVGRVSQIPAGPDDNSKTKKAEPWQAYAMLNDWADVDLGCDHESHAAARRAVFDWCKKQVTRTKRSCPAHAQYRAGCILCDEANKS